jgi:hypothetical protein
LIAKASVEAELRSVRDRSAMMYEAKEGLQSSLESAHETINILTTNTSPIRPKEKKRR